ncbi:hypothetical protein COOONC_18854 [Cooperia oncophora]
MEQTFSVFSHPAAATTKSVVNVPTTSNVRVIPLVSLTYVAVLLELFKPLMDTAEMECLDAQQMAPLATRRGGLTRTCRGRSNAGNTTVPGGTVLYTINSLAAIFFFGKDRTLGEQDDARIRLNQLSTRMGKPSIACLRGVLPTVTVNTAIVYNSTCAVDERY